MRVSKIRRGIRFDPSGTFLKGQSDKTDTSRKGEESEYDMDEKQRTKRKAGRVR